MSILAAYLAERYEGDIKHLADIPVPTADEPRYERVHRVLRRYDEHLTEEEREFLKLFSVFRLPVQESAFEKVFEPLLGVRATQQGKSDSALSKLFKRKKTTDSISESHLQNIVNHLVNYRLIRHDEHEKAYTTHPLIRNHYFALFTKGDPTQEKAAHKQIKDYYLSIAGDTPQYPTLNDLKPLIEVVHHTCESGAYNDAFQIQRQRIDQEGRGVLFNELGAYDTQLSVWLYFLSKSKEYELLIDNKYEKYFILNAIAFCLMRLGRNSDAKSYFEHALPYALEISDWSNASLTYRNLAVLYIDLVVCSQSNLT